MRSMKHRRRGSSLARTAFVAIATLAILLLCFSMYQYSQIAAPVEHKRPVRLPVPGEAPPPTTTGEPAGVTVGDAVIGVSKNASITLYTGKDRDSKIELTVSDWSPKAGSDHEFMLRDPEIRMRTSEGNDLRVKADDGTLEARRKGGSGLEPQRGKLSGNVVIDFDRRTAEDKEKLSEEERSQLRDDDLVRIQADELRFDVEFGRLIVPGKVVLTARDAEFEAHELEVQFDSQENRIESLRVEHGGRIRLTGQTEGVGLSLGNPSSQPERQTIVDWIRESLQAGMEARQAQDQAEQEKPAFVEKPMEPFEPSVPVFRMTKPPRPRTAAFYIGRFEGDVDARQMVGDATQSRLQADWLEILRELSLTGTKSEKKTPGGMGGSDNAAAAASAPIGEHIVLSWTGKLVVNESAASAENEPSAPARLTAGGSPAKLSHPEGDALCARLTYLPASGDMQLFGQVNEPVIVRSLQQGTVVGDSISLRRSADALDIIVAGPGRLWQESAMAGAPLSAEALRTLGLPNIEFAQQIHAVGRVMAKTMLDFTGAMTTRQYRLLDRVSFEGRTMLQQDGVSLEADQVDASFASAQSWRGVQQSLDRVLGTGNVILTQDHDRLTCDKVDIAMGSGPDGKPMIRTATASGMVSALQGDRSLQASDKLIVDFETAAAKEVVKVASDVSVGGSPLAASQSLRLGGSASPRRLRANGDVTVIDPSQSLDLSCDQLDCAIAPGGQTDIESASLSGLDDQPASIKLESFSVTGKDITVNVANEWADVPGAGRMIIQSQKDLDGRKVAKPIPIAVTWTEGMKYRGRENRALFLGHVHASSETTTSFDCEEKLLVEFEEKAGAPPEDGTSHRGLGETLGDWLPNAADVSQALHNARGLGFDPLLAAVTHVTEKGLLKKQSSSVLRGYSKEPRYIEATGKAVAQTAEMQPGGTVFKSRARISGPKLSLHFRSELSKMLIEGKGDLLLEDFQPAKPDASSSQALRTDLFSDASDSGPSKTLIKWRDRMWYDFGVDQTRFEGDVHLTHLSGGELDKVFGVPQGGTPNRARGRRTFLNADALRVDFTEARRTSRPQGEQRMGRISSDRLRRFQANGHVTLREEVDQFSLNAAEVAYERQRKTLFIHGSAQRKAQLVRQRPGKLPDQMAAERIFYNLETGKIEISGPQIKTGQ